MSTWTSELIVAPPSPHAAGFGLDRPAAGETGTGWTLTIGGWVVGDTSEAREVHVLFDGALVRRALIDVPRPDATARHPFGTDEVGFWLHVPLLGLPPTAQLEVCAMLADATPVHLGTVMVRHEPLTTPYQPQLSPIMVTSLGRMGTTWLMHLLACHPGVAVHEQYPHELGMAKYLAHLLQVASAPADHLDSVNPDTFTAAHDRVGHNPYFGDFLDESPDLNQWLAGTQPTLLGAYVQASLDGFYGEVAVRNGVPDARYFAEKTLPDRVPDVLHDLYPAARELVLVRDIRDVVCSAIAFDEKRGRRSFGREGIEDDLGFVRQLGMDLERLAAAWRRRQGRSLLVRYETLVATPAASLHEIFEHLGLASSPDVVASVLEQASDSTGELDAHRTSSSPAASIGRWRTELAERHPELLEHCEERFSPLLAELGYASVSGGKRSRGLQKTVQEQLLRLEPVSS